MSKKSKFRTRHLKQMQARIGVQLDQAYNLDAISDQLALEQQYRNISIQIERLGL